MHQSAFDTLVWDVLPPGFAFVLKRELTRIPLFGPMLLLPGMIPVDRERRRGRNARPAARRRPGGGGGAADRHLSGGHARRRRASRSTLQPGVAALAARTRLPVIPVATDSGLRWGRRAFRKRPGVIHIAILPPIEAGPCARGADGAACRRLRQRRRGTRGTCG